MSNRSEARCYVTVGNTLHLRHHYPLINHPIRLSEMTHDQPTAWPPSRGYYRSLSSLHPITAGRSCYRSTLAFRMHVKLSPSVKVCQGVKKGTADTPKIR